MEKAETGLKKEDWVTAEHLPEGWRMKKDPVAFLTQNLDALTSVKRAVSFMKMKGYKGEVVGKFRQGIPLVSFKKSREEKYESLRCLDRRRVRKADEQGDDVDSILEKYKHLGQNENEGNDLKFGELMQKEAKCIFPNERNKEVDEEDEMDDNDDEEEEGGADDCELDENEAELLMATAEELAQNNEGIITKTKDVEEELINIDNFAKDDEGDLVNDCVEDTSDYLTEPEDNDEEQDGTIITNKETTDTINQNHTTQEVKIHDMEDPGKKRKVKCNQCDWTGGQTGLNYHKKSKHLGIRFKCPHCEFSSPRTENLTSHIMSKHIKVVENIIRDATTVLIEDEEIFEKLVDAEVELEVSKAKHQLQKEVTIKVGDSMHIEKLHKQDIKKGDSEKEEKENVENLKEVSEKENGFKCSQCAWIVGTGNGLRYHQRSVHEGLKNGKYNCNCCKFKSTSKTYMTNHMMVEHNLKSPQDFESFPSKVKTEQGNGGVGKGSNSDCDEEDDELLPPFWQPADGGGLVFSPAGGEERRFPSYQHAVRWLVETGYSIIADAHAHAGFIELILPMIMTTMLMLIILSGCSFSHSHAAAHTGNSDGANPDHVYSLWLGLQKEGWLFEPLLPPGWRRRSVYSKQHVIVFCKV